MSDSSTFREVADEVISEPVTSEESTQTETTEVNEQVQAPETTPEVEKFAEDKDLTGLTPEELLETKREWERAYTQKRQKEAAELREMRQQLEQFQQQGSQTTSPELQYAQADAQQQVELGNMTLEQYTDYMRELLVEEARQIAREEYQTLNSTEKEETNQQQLLSEFVSIDPRLDESSPDHDESVERRIKSEVADALDDHLAQFGTSQGFDAKAVTRDALDRYDQEIDLIVKKRTQMSVQAATMRAAKSSKSQERGTTSNSNSTHGNSIRDILSDTVDGA